MRLTDELDHADIETHWKKIKVGTLEAASEVCGVKKNKKEEWLNAEVEQLSEAKDSLFMKWQTTHGRSKSDDAYEEYKKAKRACVKAVRRSKAEVKSRKARELEQHAKDNNTRALYQTIKKLEGTKGSQGERSGARVVS